MKRIAIVHFLPLELYPPIVNLFNFIGEQNDNSNRFEVFTTHNDSARQAYKSEKIRIHRYPASKPSDSRIFRLVKYIHFNLSVLIRLLIYKPDTILYYETYSAMPVYWYSKYFNSNVKLLIHNHEYFDKDWYNRGMKIVKIYHEKELSYLYNKAEYISQTNLKRLELFAEDNPLTDRSKLDLLPNYPSESWRTENDKDIMFPVRLVYIGSLGVNSCYLSEICNYVINADGKFILDIFSFNLDKVTHHYLNSLNSKHISYISQGVEYNKLPELLTNYDIGLILYKSESLNFRYNAPNKFFEYLSCDLDVWFPKGMKGLNDYQNYDTYPKVVKLDFENLNEVNFNKIISRKDLIYKPTDYYYQPVYKKFLRKLLDVS